MLDLLLWCVVGPLFVAGIVFLLAAPVVLIRAVMRGVREGAQEGRKS